MRTRPTTRRAWPADCQAKLACSSRPREIDTEPSTAGVAAVRRRASASPARYSAIISPELPSASAARNGVRPVRSGAIRCESRAPARLPNGTSASRRLSSASAQLAAWKPPLCSASPPANSGFSAAALTSTASTSCSPASASCSAPATGGRQRRPNGSCRRAGGSTPAVSVRSRADTVVRPGSGRAAATALANASRLPWSAWKLSAAIPIPASSSSHRSAHTSAAVPKVAALELMSGSASPGAIASRLRLAVLALAGEREAELGEHREVAGPEPAEVAHGRDAVLREHARERDGDLGPAAAARRHLREPHQDRRPHGVVGQRLAQPAGMAAQEPQGVAPEIAEDVDVPVGADAGGAAVDRAHGRDVLGGPVADRHPLARGGRDLHVEGTAAGRRHEGRGRERLVPDAQPHPDRRSSSWRSSASSPTSRTSSGRPRCAAARSAAARVAGVGRWASQSTRV